MMPTKARRAREVEQRKMFDAMGLIPAYLANADMSLNEAAKNIGIYKGGLVSFTDGGEAYLHPNTGKIANRDRRELRGKDARRLQKKYRDIWGKRGCAKGIAIDTGLSERTIQAYIKDFPIT